MAERQSGRQGQSNRTQQGKKGPQTRSFSFDDFLRGDVPMVELPPTAPRTTRQLMGGWNRNLDSRLGDGVGMVAESIETQPSKKGIEGLRVVIPGDSELVRTNDRIPAENLQTREELRNQAPLIEDTKHGRKALGRFAVESATVLMIGDEAFSFRPSDLKGAAEGMAGGPLTTHLKEEIAQDAIDEYVVIVPNKSGKRVMVVQSTGDDYETKERAHAAKERVIQGLGAELEQIKQAGGDRSLQADLAKRISHLTEVQEVHIVRDTSLGEELEKATRTIDMEIDGHRHTSEAFTYLDGEANVLTVARPVRFDLEKAGLDKTKIELYDGTGKNRKKVLIEKGGSPTDILSRIVKGRRRGDKVQKQKGGPLEMPTLLKPARQLRLGYPVVTSFLR